jgi:hypothetical protein
MAIRCISALVLAVVLAAPAPAAKWAGGCPKAKMKLNRVGRSLGGGSPYAISKYFEHVGHELTFHLRSGDVTRYGGFSTEPGGNTLEVTFTPLLGTPIPLPPVQVTASSPSTLTIVVPDTRRSSAASSSVPRISSSGAARRRCSTRIGSSSCPR